MSRRLISCLSVLFLSACSAAPNEGAWAFDAVSWEQSDCSDLVVDLVPLEGSAELSATTDGTFSLDTYLGDLRCNEEDGRYMCDPMVMLEIELAEVDSLMVWTVHYAGSFSSPNSAHFDVDILGACEGSGCDFVSAAMAGAGEPVVCGASGSQRAVRR